VAQLCLVEPVPLRVCSRLVRQHDVTPREDALHAARRARPRPPEARAAGELPDRVLLEGVLEPVVSLTPAPQAPGETPRRGARDEAGQHPGGDHGELRDVAVMAGRASSRFRRLMEL
jgi:hypothetical protein